MFVMYFTEQPMSAYPADIGLEAGHTALMFSNKHFDPVAGSRLYNEYLEHYKLAEEVGFDGIMLNEHHNAPFCMQAKCNVFASILAAMTKRVKLVLLGNPLPLADNPVRLAEELAMIDMVSRGRLVSGFVRGGGQEQLAAGVNPAYNRERFEEAHALIVKAWTQVGPFRWEGTHYLHRCHVAETEEKAMANAKQFMWMQGEFTGLAHPVWSSPSGYFSPSYRTAFVEYAVGRRSNPRGAAFDDQIRNQQIVAGTPKTVIPKLRRLLEETRPSIMGFWASDGFVSNEDTKTCIRLLGQEVLPALRDIGKELGLWSPFEANAPTSIHFPEPARPKATAR